MLHVTFNFFHDFRLQLPASEPETETKDTGESKEVFYFYELKNKIELGPEIEIEMN